jgi:hypothetical protein
MLSLLLAFALPGAHALQPPGTFHQGEAVARHGERWLALRVQADDARLDTTRLRVNTVFDELLDAEGQATGSEVGSDKTDVVTYLRGTGLHAGPVARARSEDTAGDSGLVAQTLTLGDKAYRLATRCEAAVPEGGFMCDIALIEGERSQTLVRMTAQQMQGRPGLMLGDDASPHLIFAGDLDRDGKLDLVFDTTDHYNLSRPVLFLSGAAEGDELLHAVAEHSAVGC